MDIAIFIQFLVMAAISFACGVMYSRAAVRDEREPSSAQNEVHAMFTDAAKHGAVALLREDGRIAVITCANNRVSKVSVFCDIDDEDVSEQVSATIGEVVMDHLKLDA